MCQTYKTKNVEIFWVIFIASTLCEYQDLSRNIVNVLSDAVFLICMVRSLLYLSVAKVYIHVCNNN